MRRAPTARPRDQCRATTSRRCDPAPARTHRLRCSSAAASCVRPVRSSRPCEERWPWPFEESGSSTCSSGGTRPGARARLLPGNRLGRQRGRRERDTGMRPWSAKIQSGYRRRMTRQTGYGTHEQNLIERELPVRETPFGRAVPILDVPRRQHLPGDDSFGQPRQILAERANDEIAHAIAPRVIPCAIAELVRHPLNEYRQDVTSTRGERRIMNRWQPRLEVGMVGDPPVLRRVEGTLEIRHI